jgi:NTP pyrophosphatase (non-canonical NTP hydrolase)
MKDVSLYHEMVNNLVKRNLQENLTEEKFKLLYMAVGVVGKAGELIDAVKKHVVYGKPLGAENMLEELGDIEFYLEGIRQALFITRGQCLRANMLTLSLRYPAGRYSDAAAVERLDKEV